MSMPTVPHQSQNNRNVKQPILTDLNAFSICIFVIGHSKKTQQFLLWDDKSTDKSDLVRTQVFGARCMHSGLCSSSADMLPETTFGPASFHHQQLSARQSAPLVAS